MAEPRVWTVVVAGGAGTRFGGPKQYVEIAGRRVLDWSVDAARSVSAGIVVVVPGPDVARVAGDLGSTVEAVVAGGRTRSESVRAGLAAVPDDADVILVHDAARPGADRAIFEAVVAAVVAGADGVVPGVPVTDTLRWRDGGVLDRDAVVAVQTPQGFAAAPLRAAHAGGHDATDDASLVEAAGGRIVVVEGSPANRKLTHPDDVEALARAIGGRA